MMDIKILEDDKKAAEQIALALEEVIRKKPDALICLCGGYSPLPVFEKLVYDANEGKYPTDRFKFISLDEWVGLGIEDTGSCVQIIANHFLQPLNIPNERYFFFDGLANDLEGECSKAKDFIECNGGIEVILLGVGLNGHVGFNEPPAKKTDGIRIIELSETSKKVSGKYFNKEYDLWRGITLGIAQIMDADKVMVMATGAHKQDIVERAVNGNEDENCPVTLIKDHKNICMYLDESAAQKIK